jgi:hypothetical protein
MKLWVALEDGSGCRRSARLRRSPCNVFEYWCGRDAGALARALMTHEGIASIGFERKYPTGFHERAGLGQERY